MAQARQKWDYINPGEGDSFGLDFTEVCVNPLFPGDAVNPAVSPVWTMWLAQGTDPAPNHLTGSPSLTGNITSAVAVGCIAGNIYVLKATIATLAGRVLNLWQYLECREIPQVASP